MDFRRVSTYFDNLEFRDAYSNAVAFFGQLDLFDEAKRDSETALRRIISTSATALIPARRAVRAGGIVYLIGQPHQDSFQGIQVRVGYASQKAGPLASILSLDEACLGLPGTVAYASRAWIKDTAFSEQSSIINSQYHINFGITENVKAADIVRASGDYFVVRSVSEGESGLLIATCDLLKGVAPEPATIQAGAYSATTETFTGAPVTAPVLALRWQSLFAYGGGQADPFAAGDIQIVAAKSSVTMIPGARVTLSSGIWTVLSVVSVGAAWVCRAAKHG